MKSRLHPNTGVPHSPVRRVPFTATVSMPRFVRTALDRLCLEDRCTPYSREAAALSPGSVAATVASIEFLEAFWTIGIEGDGILCSHCSEVLSKNYLSTT